MLKLFLSINQAPLANDRLVCLEKATQHKKLPECQSNHTFPSIDVDHALGLLAGHVDPDMDNHSSEEVLDCLLAIYKV